MGILSRKWFVVGPGREPIPEVGRPQMASRLTFGTEAEGRYELDDRGLRLYDPAGELVADLKTLDGTAMFGDEDGTRVFIDPTRLGSISLFHTALDNAALIEVTDDRLILQAPWDTGNTPAAIVLTQGSTPRAIVGPILSLIETTTPPTPVAQTVSIYPKDKAGVSTLYYKNDAGTEYELGPTATHTHTESEITDFAHTHGAGDLPAPPPTNVFLGRRQRQAATWTNAPADGWENWGGTDPLQAVVTKAEAGTNLLVKYAYSVFRTTAGGAHQSAVHESVTGTRYDAVTAFINGVGEHEHLSGHALIAGLGTGSHTLTLQIDNTSAAGNVETATDDYGSMEVWEVA